VVEIAKAIDAALGLKFSGIQAYQGIAQHLRKYEDRKALIDVAVAIARDAVEALKKEGLTCDIVGGAGSGTYYFEGNSGSTMNYSAAPMRSWITTMGSTSTRTASASTRGVGECIIHIDNDNQS